MVAAPAASSTQAAKEQDKDQRKVQALPARTSTETDIDSQRWKTQAHPARWGQAALLASRARLHNTVQNKLGANRGMS